MCNASLVSLIKPENMHIVSARLFLESAIPRENALCAEIYMRSIILCELEEKPTYVTLPEDADIYLYGFAIDFVSIFFLTSFDKIRRFTSTHETRTEK